MGKHPTDLTNNQAWKNAKRTGMGHDPIDRIEWLPAAVLDANDYNPNVVFTPELELLKRSIILNGWTQPVLVTPERQIIDGFHRWRLSQDVEALRVRYEGMVPVAIIDIDRPHAMLMTIRMNRAKGTHVALRMHSVIRELIEDHGLEEQEIADNIGATLDEIKLLREANIFKARNLADAPYSKAWEPKEVKKQK